MKKIYLFLLLIGFIPTYLTAQYITAEDDAANYSTWSDEDNNGSGFTAWDMWTTGNAGFFLGNAENQGFGTINTSDKAFGMYGNTGSEDYSNAQRLVNNWADGAVFSVDIAVAYRNGSKGIDIFASGYENVWNFNVGGDQYTTGGVNQTSWSYSQTSVFTLIVTQNGSDMDISLTRESDSYSTTITGKTFSGFKFYCGNTELGDLNNLYFNNLKIEYSDPSKVPAAANVNINGNVDLAADESLTVNDLTVDGSNTLTIKSTSSGTGSLIVNGTVSGNVTVERYLTHYVNATDAKYHFISSPVSAQKIQDVMEGEVVTDENFVTDPPTAGVDFYKFYELTNTWINSKVSGGAWNTEFENNFVVGRGYLAAYPTAPVTKAFSGTLNNDASFALNCTYTDGEGNGWNLLGNPYPAAIDWDEVTSNGLANVDNALYYYDAAEGNYRYYIKLVADDPTSALGDGSRYIPSGQGFMVHAQSGENTKTVTIEKADLTHTGQDVYYKSSTNLLAGSLSLQITGNNFSDQTIIHFNEQASTDFDGNYDAFKLMSANMQVPMIYTENEENTQFAINGLPQVEEGTSIPVSLRIGADGTYTIEANINEIETNIFLEDLFTGTSTKLNETSSYSFTASEGDDPNRFLLHFGMVGVGEQEQASTLQAYVVDNRLYVNNSLEQAQLAVYDLQGRLVAEQSLNSGGLQSLPLELPAGMYIVRLNNASESRAVKINVQ